MTLIPFEVKFTTERSCQTIWHFNFVNISVHNNLDLLFIQEVDWMPCVDQLRGTLPTSFHERYHTTYAIIDGSEIFLETPSDFHMQSSTWSSYRHHNTARFLITCTPNGAVSFISPLLVGSISDAKFSGFIEK